MCSAVAVDSPHELIHVAVMRKVRKGHEAEFESQIAKFFGDAAEQPGVHGAYLIRPVIGSDAREYGILRSFRSKDDMRRFYESDLYRRWNETIGSLVEGEPRKTELHGLEAFFRSQANAPPRWKMAVVTWIGVNPAVYIFSTLAPVLGQVPGLTRLFVVNAFVVASLTWVFMPLLTRLFRPWLHPSAK